MVGPAGVTPKGHWIPAFVGMTGGGRGFWVPAFAGMTERGAGMMG